jgi:hypothetical protein
MYCTGEYCNVKSCNTFAPVPDKFYESYTEPEQYEYAIVNGKKHKLEKKN